MHAVAIVLFLVVLATAVATGARRVGLPAPSLLVIAGMVVGFLPFVPRITVTPDLIGVIVLPPLLYASAEEMPLRDLRKVWRPVTVLAVGLVLASAAVVGAVASWVAPLPASMAFVLGAILASTDPVAVTALGRRLALPPRIGTMIQAESLFNDATSLVLYKVAVSVAIAGGAVSWEAAGGEFVMLAGGGAVVGAVVALVVGQLRKHTEDAVLETVLALVTPYAAYVVAESVHGSGVTAVVVAGVLLGGRNHRLTTAGSRLQLHAVYGTVVFLLESVVFALIGLELPYLLRAMEGEDRWWPLQVLAVVAAMLLCRTLWVGALSVAMQRRRGRTRPSWRVPAVLSWAGTRGVMPLAAALSLPLALPMRSMVMVIVAATLVVTLVAQGLTLAPLVRRSGIALEPADTQREEARARERVARAALERLEELGGLEALPEVAVDRMRRSLAGRLEAARERLEEGADGGDAPGVAYAELRRELIGVETAELRRLFEAHEIGDGTRRRIQRSLDLEAERLGGG
ncbi:Na+/H+ antiporter [Mangrovactinospora gilvigrisea]|uniref:Na+/H+ antiporter n=1 Tax=Mangrovactinospora gilvigrisea TaxID=1428644 RepID=A0A1J7BCF9_9ACTN|nr:Na+/H+ antiporter [Mangrovactinospora gilvigrisea]OIV36334.1 Na+/H+ antiporter [Mangrovactinospora gilvigrisea]